jgi:hypothetical protein
VIHFKATHPADRLTRQGVRDLNLVGKPPKPKHTTKASYWHRCDSDIEVLRMDHDGREYVAGYRCSLCDRGV